MYICAYTGCLHFHIMIYVEEQYTQLGDASRAGSWQTSAGEKQFTQLILLEDMCQEGWHTSLVMNHLSEKEAQTDQE